MVTQAVQWNKTTENDNHPQEKPLRFCETEQAILWNLVVKLEQQSKFSILKQNHLHQSLLITPGIKGKLLCVSTSEHQK